MNYVPNTQTTLWLAPITRSGVVVVAATGLSLRIVEGERRAIHISSSPSSVLPPSSCPFIPSMYFIRQETRRQTDRGIGSSGGVTDGRTVTDGREGTKREGARVEGETREILIAHRNPIGRGQVARSKDRAFSQPLPLPRAATRPHSRWMPACVNWAAEYS